MQQNDLSNTSMQQTVQEEISLRELIMALWQGKLIIVIITIVALLLGIVYSFFITTDIYRATAIIMTTPVDLSLSRSDEDVISSIGKYPAWTIESYLQQIKSPPVMLATIQILDLKQEDGAAWSVNQLSGMVEASNIDKTNLISISVDYSDPQRATLIANEISQQFSKYITEISQHQGMQTAGIIAELLAEEEQNMHQKSIALTAYLRHNDSIELLKNEVSSLVSQITTIKSQLNSLDATITADTDSLVVLLSAQSTDPQIDFDDYAVILDLTQSSINRINQLQLNLGNDFLPTALLQIELVGVQTRLLGNLATRDALKTQLDDLNTTMREQQILLNEEEYKYNGLVREFNLAEETYTAYQSMYKDALLTAASDIGQTIIVIVSVAIVPDHPIAPSKMLNIAISLVIGLMLGVLVALFLSYWKNSKTTA